MESFKKILYVSDGIGDETAALKQAFRTAHNNKSSITALVVCPDVPKSFDGYEAKYHGALKEQVLESAQAARKALKISEDSPLAVSVEGGSAPAIRVVRHVLADAYDLVMKEAAFQDGGKGFRAMDMALLRKCPCPVWLTRPIERSHGEIQVAVAIDPEGDEVAGRDLGLELLKTARDLADTCNGTLNIFSCWDYEFEDYLTNNSRIHMSKEDIKTIVESVRVRHHDNLNLMIQKSGIGGNIKIHHERGRPEKAIPDLVAKEKVDILVMGTVGRVGIQGFVMGNTAEDILQNLQCSLLAMKPKGFVSSVKAD